MSTITDKKITDGQRDAVWVQHQQDRLTGTPQQNKAVFDEYSELIREHFNDAMDAIDGRIATNDSDIEQLKETDAGAAATAARESAESASESAQATAELVNKVISISNKRYVKDWDITDEQDEFEFTATDYTYNDSDTYEVFVNGLKLESSEFTQVDNVVTLNDAISGTGNTVEIIVTTNLKGKGIADTELNDDYTLTINYDDGTSMTTESIRGEKGEKGDKGDGVYDDTQVKADIAVLDARMDTFTHLAEGSTTGDAELIDARVDASGKTYTSAGDAVRGQVTDVKSDLNKIASIVPQSPNVYNPANEQPNTIIASGGAETYNANYVLDTEYIPAVYGQYVSCYGGTSTTDTGVAFVVSYDSNKDYIARTSFQYGAIRNWEVSQADIAFIRIVVWTNSTDVAVYINDTNPGYTSDDFPYIPYYEASAEIRETALPESVQEAAELVTDLEYDYRTEDITDVAEEFTQAYVNSSGEFVHSTSWNAYILQVSELGDYSEITFKSNTNTTSRYQVAFYSSDTPTNETFISGEIFTVASSLNTLVIDEVPSNAVSLLLTNLIAGGDISIVKKSAEKESKADINEKNVNELQTLSLMEQRAKFDNRFNYIAYSAMLASGAGPNSESQYLWGAQRKFVSIKGDVRISSDGEIVMCHDEGFTLNGDGEVTAYDVNNMTPIRNMTAAQCYALVYEGTDDHVCGLDALVRTCKLYGKVAFITVRSSYHNEIFPKIFECLDRYNMRERAIINGFNIATMKKARKFDENIMLSWVQTHNHKITTDDVDSANALGNCLISCYDYSGTQTKATNQSDAVLAYAQSKDVRVYEAIIGYDTDLNNAELYDRGFTGAQVAFEPQIFSTFA